MGAAEPFFVIDVQPYFQRFLERLALDATRVERIESAVRHLDDVVKRDVRLRRHRPKLVGQGSYANGLAIRPLNARDEYDVDIVIELDLGPTTTSGRALDWLAGRLATDAAFAERLVEHDRCVRIDYAGDFHLDVVPGRRRRTESGYFSGRVSVPDRVRGWRRSYPRGFSRWCEKQDARTGGDFTRVVWMLKRWRDLQAPDKRRVRSIVFTTLIGRTVPSWRGPRASTRPDADVVCETLARLERALARRRRVPRIANPSLPTEDLARDWTSAGFLRFRAEVVAARGAADRALESGQPNEWRALFGDAFPASL